MSDAGEAAALYSRLYHEAKAELAKANKDIQELKDGFKFAYENGSFYPKAFDYLDPIYEKHLKDKQ